MQQLPPPYPGRFLHAINMSDWYPCWNLALFGRLWSPDFVALLDHGMADAHTPLRDVSIDVLREAGVPQGTFTPRAGWYVWAAAWIRRGGTVGIGTDDTRWISPEGRDKTLRLGDIELEFEANRRELLPDGASRLASLYVVEDSRVGRAHIDSMLSGTVHVLHVTIPSATRVTKVDTAWFDAYCREPNPEFIAKYWGSVPLDVNAPTWEYLVDGMIEVEPSDIEYVREFGAHHQLASGQA